MMQCRLHAVHGMAEGLYLVKLKSRLTADLAVDHRRSFRWFGNIQELDVRLV
ncbi:MAG: hypothetical protein ACE5K9_06595 [Candidatus Methylomirabilales bacterium]